MSYKEDMKIDPDALDVEWLKQPDLEMKYIELCANARKELRYAEEEVKTVRSELINEANESPKECCGKEKPNAADIEAYYRSNDRYKAAKQQFVEAQEAAQILEDMKNAIHFTRTKALENLVTLQSQNYFAGPQAPRNLIKEMEKKEEQKKALSKSIGSKLRRKS